MGVINRRNAVVGWTTIKVGKRLVRPAPRSGASGAKAGGIAAGTLAALGGLLFWRKARGSGGGSDAAE